MTTDQTAGRRCCAVCLYRVGFGAKAIGRRLGRNVNAVAKWLRQAGVYNPKPMTSEQAAKNRGHWHPEWKQRRDANHAGRQLDLLKVDRDSATYARKYYRRHKRKIYRRMRSDPQLVLRAGLRCRLWNVLFHRKQRRARGEYHMADVIGCSWVELRRHFESLFTDGMGWHNRGQWHIDHIIPCAAFDLSKRAEVERCFHYSNLQPMWGTDNRRKHDKMPDGKLGRHVLRKSLLVNREASVEL